MIYIVYGGWDYEGFNNIAVYDVEEYAQSRVEEERKTGEYEYVEYDAFELNPLEIK